MRAVPLLLLLLLGMVCTAAPAQTSDLASDDTARGTAPASAAPPAGRTSQRTERIQIEDAGSRVDELRVGGQTQRISVQPKAGGLPGYEVQSSDGTRNRFGAGTGPRVWNLLTF
ncbi:hypothetical protein D8B23_16850 [Verminephrobacter aporrectodeae subsp. tuberculatae]|uniref:DUF2782 domain-containing protein n=1 Tax=Verminephrobacter aporrectodeae subsp. tuberculatae TaxID=1110392 RepID=A0ABT3KRQ7_9BURK|nr:hypothetical protein [Verminephrobacter aporrectodeae]MCW5220097.1 hypothetical protein [Verminephrobacter aporrectodeae subsp. tuberculatae]MCW5289385.1 hypothetical protein [Verminephrobacter aporrectodeae subsp. tuberculatae]MCW5320950.1 hypothetical protein [Verminephrobacter aporrectodeae subsp. tuberculatae]MCW8164539.1 hypothetical protein [Verminephrobacter aporrectodeae subsp. tuberculatae]MCW8169809.1 hypothetical protein [Verminephrobacter aporrectodeae subsp. tuberculatae]